MEAFFIQGSVLLVVLGASFSSGQIPGFGRCPELPVVQNFDVKAYSGKWYEIEKYFAVFEIGGICITAEYLDLGNGTMAVRNQQIQTISGQVRITEGTARVTDPNGGGKLGFSFPAIRIAGEAPYWVLDTDYTSYSLVWSCNNFGLMNFRILWFLSRNRTPSQEVQSYVTNRLRQLNIASQPLQRTQQEGCAAS